MDYSTMSDAELEKIAAGDVPPEPDYKNMSDAELEKLAGSSVPVLQEMHPAFSDADRLVVKNFSANNEAAVNYLQKKHPNLEISVDDTSGQIKARARDGSEAGYRVLDPDQGVVNSFTSLAGAKEGLRDIGDVGYDALSGVGTGLATAAGGLVGAGAGGIGALPAAVGAGAASSAGFEGLRQGLGKLLGMEGNFDAGSLAGAGIGGAASPLLLGTGGTVGGALGRKLVAEGADAAAIQSAQRGLIGRGVDKFVKPGLAKVGGFLSGTSGEAVDTLGKNLPALETIENTPYGTRRFVQETGQQVNDKFRAAKGKAWDEFSQAVGQAGDAETVNLAPVKDRFKAAIADAEKNAKAGKGTEASQELLAKLKDAYNRYFVYDDVVQVPTQTMKPTGLLDAAGQPLMAPSTDMVEQTVKKELEVLSPKAALDLDRKLADLAEFDRLDPHKVTGGRLGGLGADEKNIATLGAALKKDLGKEIDSVIPANAMPARKQYGQLANLEKEVNKFTQSPQQAFTNLRNADVVTRAPTKDLFAEIDATVGTDLLKRAKMAEALELFGKGRKSVFSGDLMKRAPAAMAGGAAGAYLGNQGDGKGGYIPGIGGAIAGGLLGGPAAMRFYVKNGLRLGQANQALGPARVGLGAKAIGDNMPLFNPWLGIENK